MIKINLAKRRKNQGAGGGTAKKGFDLKDLTFATLISKLKSGAGGEEGKKFDFNNPIVKIALAIGATLLLDDTLEGYKQEKLKKINDEITVVEKEKTALQARLAKIKGFEPVKKRLEEDEIAIRTKLDVINRLLSNRSAPSKVMMQLAQAIPEEVWLTDLKFSEKNVKLVGSTASYNQVSDFIKALHETSQFTEINLSGIQESTNEKKDQRFQTFELDASRRQVN